jgi:hypothetical protein
VSSRSTWGFCFLFFFVFVVVWASIQAELGLRRRWHRRLVIALVLQEDWWNFASDLLAVISTVSRYGVDNGEPWRDFHLSWRSLSSIVCCIRISSRHLYSSMQLLVLIISSFFIFVFEAKEFLQMEMESVVFRLVFHKSACQGCGSQVLQSRQSHSSQ